MKLNVGPGRRWKKKGWTTLDHYVSGADLLCDLRDAPRIELPSRSVKKVFCSHVIEHISDEAADSLFAECHRLLGYDGVARFACPDLELLVAQYRAGLCDPLAEVVSSTMKDAPSHLRLLNVLASFEADQYQGIKNAKENSIYSGGPIATEAEVATKVAESSNAELSRWAVDLIPDNATYRAHINAYWADKLIGKMRKAGFADVRQSTFQGSSDEELRGPSFDNRPTVTLFVEGRARGAVKRVLAAGARLRRRLRSA